MGDVDPGPEMRVGDDDRRAVDTRLQRAHAEGRITLTEYDDRAERCWKARTQADLDVLTRDLPSAFSGTRPAPHAPARPRRPRLAGTLGGIAVLAVLGYAGVQVLGAADGRAVLGDTTVNVAAGQEKVQVGMLLGDVTVVVPDDAHVARTGTVIAGDVTCGQACTPAPPGGRTLVVDASGALGDVHVLTASESAARPSGRGDRHDD
jgi:hypothetical protein